MTKEQIETLKNNVAIVDKIEWDDNGLATNLEYCSNVDGKWSSTDEFDGYTYYKYRIKPQKQYRPFKSVNEMIETLGVDFWVTNVSSGSRFNTVYRVDAIDLSGDENCLYFDEDWISLDTAFEQLKVINPLTKEEKSFGVLE